MSILPTAPLTLSDMIEPIGGGGCGLASAMSRTAATFSFSRPRTTLGGLGNIDARATRLAREAAYRAVMRALFGRRRMHGKGGQKSRNEDFNGVVLYEGPSLLDGVPIMLIATGATDASDNSKTGDMLQTWIMLRDTPPHVATHTAADASICGACPKRPINVLPGSKQGDRCYVSLKTVWSIWNAGQSGAYPHASPAEFARITAGRNLRLGSYGDPAATPLHLWEPAIRTARGITGYTHQWREASVQPWRKYLMASTESVQDTLRAQTMGWRTFRAGREPLMANERMCPASKEAGELLSCAACRLCDGGLRGTGRPSIRILPH